MERKIEDKAHAEKEKCKAKSKHTATENKIFTIFFFLILLFYYYFYLFYFIAVEDLACSPGLQNTDASSWRMVFRILGNIDRIIIFISRVAAIDRLSRIGGDGNEWLGDATLKLVI